MARIWYYAVAPVNLIMLGWLFYGRGYTGAALAWMYLITVVIGIPLVVLPMFVLTITAYTTRRSSRTVTKLQGVIYLLLWSAMFVCGATIVDFTDHSGQEGSAVTQWFGREWMNQSSEISVRSAVAILVLLVCLAVTQWVQREHEPRGDSE